MAEYENQHRDVKLTNETTMLLTNKSMNTQFGEEDRVRGTFFETVDKTFLTTTSIQEDAKSDEDSLDSLLEEEKKDQVHEGSSITDSASHFYLPTPKITSPSVKNLTSQTPKV